jgi:alkylation response protein AidB-like acyl-CoA dehydrogenase
MDLSLDESQRILQRSFSEFFARECPTELVRGSESTGFDETLWRRFCELGAAAMGLPQAYGGLDMGLFDLGLVAAQIGQSLAPLPFADVASAGRLLATLPDIDETLMTSIAEGTGLISLCDRSQELPGGNKVCLPNGAIVAKVITLQGEDLLLWDLEPQHATVANMGSGALAIHDLSLAVPRRLASGPQARMQFEHALAEWKLLVAAMQTGLAKKALEIGADYARTRIQFDVPIASFQAIAHPLAEAATQVDGAELLWQQAAWSRANSAKRFLELASMALAFCSQVARNTSDVALHTHGGYGFTTEYDIQLFYRRSGAWSCYFGGVSNAYCEVARQRRANAMAGK